MPYGAVCSHVSTINFEVESAHATMCYRNNIESECHQCSAQSGPLNEHQVCYQQCFSSS